MQEFFDSCEMLLIFKINSWSDCMPPFHTPEAIYWLVGIVYASVRAAMFVWHLWSQCSEKKTQFFLSTHRQLEHRDEELAEFDKNGIGLELWTAPLTTLDNGLRNGLSSWTVRHSASSSLQKASRLYQFTMPGPDARALDWKGKRLGHLRSFKF